MSRLQVSKLHLQRGVVGDPPRGVDPVQQQRAGTLVCEAWFEADGELLKSSVATIDAIVEYASPLRILDLFERWPWSAVDQSGRRLALASRIFHLLRGRFVIELPHVQSQ